MGHVFYGLAVRAELRVSSLPSDSVGAQPEPTHDDPVREFTETLREEGRAGKSEDLSDFMIASHRGACGGEGVVEDASISKKVAPLRESAREGP